MSPERQTALRLFAIYAALLIYASYYPFEFDAARFSQALAGQAPRGWLPWGGSSTGDRIINFIAYLPLGLLLGGVAGLSSRKGGIAAAALGFAMSLTVELTQHFTSSRHPNRTDVILNTVGSAAGGLLWPLAKAQVNYWLSRFHWPHLWSPPGLLLMLWVSIHSAPFIAMIEAQKIFVPLDGDGVTALGLLRWVTLWLLLAMVVRVSFERYPWRWMIAIAIASLLMPYFFRHHRLGWDELVGLPCAAMLLPFAARSTLPVFALAALAMVSPPGQPADREYLLWMETVYLAAGAGWLLAGRLKKGSWRI